MNKVSNLMSVFLSLAGVLLTTVAAAATAPLTQDTFNKSNDTTRNHGANPVIVVQFSPSKRGLMQFDLAGFGGDVSLATLTINVTSINAVGAVDLHIVTSAWNENVVTYDSQPSFDGPAASFSVGRGDVGGSVTIDITAIAQYWVTNPGSNFGLLLMSNGATARFGSKEGGLGATLEVVTDGAPPPPPPPPPPPGETCVINGVPSGWYIAPADDTAGGLIETGQKPVLDGFLVRSDIGYFGPTFVEFDLPRFDGLVLFGKLRIQIAGAYFPEYFFDELAIALWDVNDLPLLNQPLWTVEEWETAKADLSSGRAYGSFSVRLSPADDGRILEVPLSYDAMYDIGSAAEGAFTIGIANGDGWTGEGEGVEFRKPVDGGVVQLVIPNCKIK